MEAKAHETAREHATSQMGKVISSVKSNLITMLNRRERVNKTTEAATLSFDALSYFCPRTKE